MAAAPLVRRPRSIKSSATFVHCHLDSILRPIMVAPVAAAAYWPLSVLAPVDGAAYIKRWYVPSTNNQTNFFVLFQF